MKILLLLLLIMTANYAFGGSSVLDDKISFSCYEGFLSKIDNVSAQLSEQPKLDFETAIRYIKIQRTYLMNIGMSEASYEVWCDKALNNKTPREMFIMVGGMMLSEYVNSFDQKEPGEGLDEKLSPQRQKYLKQMRSYGLRFLKDYGAQPKPQGR